MFNIKQVADVPGCWSVLLLLLQTVSKLCFETQLIARPKDPSKSCREQRGMGALCPLWWLTALELVACALLISALLKL
jgi:hypothetical protein